MTPTITTVLLDGELVGFHETANRNYETDGGALTSRSDQPFLTHNRRAGIRFARRSGLPAE
jgi:hypothetical protein